MGLETEYVEYGIELSLAVLGVSAAYFVQFSNPASFAALIFLPMLYGYTTYISHEGFNHASLTSLTALVFSVLGGATAVAAIFYSLGNILVSLLSGGEGFKDFYGSTSLPLLISGLVIGASFFAYSTANPQFKQQKIDQAGDKIGETAQKTFADSGMLDQQKNSQLTFVNQTSRTTVLLTTQKVLNQSNPSREVRKSLLQSETEIPKQVYQKTKQKLDQQEPDISSKVKSLFSQNFSGKRFILVIPLLSALFYSFQPILGILTAIFGKMFMWFDN